MIKLWQNEAKNRPEGPSGGRGQGLTFWRRHWLRALAVSIAVGILALALIHQQRTLKAFSQTQQQYGQQQGVHQTAQANAALLAVYQNPYQALQAGGRIGSAQRLQWVESLSLGVNQLAVPQVRFTLQPTAIATAANGFASAEGEGLSLTPMRLDFSLLHEGDFYRLLEDLRSRAQGLFSVQNCDLRRKEAGSVELDLASGDAASGRLSGECELLWYTLEAIPAPVE